MDRRRSRVRILILAASVVRAILWSSYCQTPDELVLPLSFERGWNFFSVPLRPVSSNPDVFFDGINHGELWNFDSGQFDIAATIEPGKGYWVFLDEAITKTFKFDYPNDTTEFPQMLSLGFNSIGAVSPIAIPAELQAPVWQFTKERFEVSQDFFSVGLGYWVNSQVAGLVSFGSLANDQDQDGIPDWWEELWGFDMTDSSDFFQDPDGDNLANLPEFRAGSNPMIADTDGDGLMDDEFLLHGTSPLKQDTDGDGFSDNEEIVAESNPLLVSAIPLTKIIVSPANGENDVAVTRETIIRFNRALESSTSIDDSIFFAEFAGTQLTGDIHLSPDRKSLSLFYHTPLPGGARIRVTLRGDTIRDERGILVDANGDDHEGGDAIIEFETLGLTLLEDTAVYGRVIASELVTPMNGNGAVNVALEGVTITIDGIEPSELSVITTSDQGEGKGNFRLSPAPAGRFFVHIDGRTATNSIPAGAYYPTVGKAWESIPGEDTNVGDIFLPLIAPNSLQNVSETEDTVVTFPQQTLDDHPELAGVSLTVPAGSLFADDGTRGGMVGIAPVDPDRLPGELPDNLEFPLVITVQTDGATNFDKPVPVCFPNLPDPATENTLGAGEKSALWSFNHDTGRFEIVGPMTVSVDGQTVCTDEGVGILAPGWHGSRTGSTGDGGRTGSGRGEGGDQEPPGDQPGDVSDPVYLFSGEFYETMEDLHIPGRGIDFMWIRKYRSKIGQNTVQGNGWDFSYNISIVQEGNAILLRNGNARADRYELQPDGTFSADGFFRDLVRNPDGTFTLMFEDRGKWIFNALDGAPEAGKIANNIDRNGNTLSFFYDSSGRLSQIRDTLDRDILLAYNDAGFIETITDFANRVVRYEYFDGTTSDGNFGDLKSVTTPAVTGTVTGNDFPNGKTRSYTYSTGFADDRLNHNLLTITDGRRNDPNDSTFGQGPFLFNEYATTTDPDDFNFDHVVNQRLGGDVLDYTYIPILPSRANGNSRTRTIVNDRNGNVKEYFYDNLNHMTRLREFTGRADPTQPTTAFANRPVNKLRASDPDFFETLYEWNADSLQKRIIFPNGNIHESIYESDLNPTASPRSRGNLRIFRQLPGSHTPSGDQTVLEHRYEYDPRFGSASYVTKETDPRGNVTTHTYDNRGNRLRTVHRLSRIVEDFEYNQFGQLTAMLAPDNGSDHRRRDEFTYYDSGHQRGYHKDSIIDVENFALTTTYEYDVVGNVIREIDPKGNDTQFTVNQLNQVVRRTTRAVDTTSNVRYEKDYYYDANNNTIRCDIQNVNDQGQLEANTHFTLAYDYEILNKPIRVTEEVDEATNVIEEYVYDGNRNRILTRYGEAVANRQNTNTRGTEYDERDLEFRVVLAPGDVDQSTTQYDYDPNGNVVTVKQGIENTPRILTNVYDGFNRVVSSIDPMGNISTYRYDANNNRVGVTIEGELEDIEGNENNIRLSEVAYLYDEMDRLVRTESQFFATATQNPIGTGIAVGEIIHSDNYQTLRMVDANGHAVETVYDTANRILQETDAKGNLTTYEYDANSNVVRMIEVEKSDIGGADETFITTFAYDGLDRLIRTTDNVGNIEEFGHDSRDNVTLEIDAQRPASDRPGNINRSTFDGLNRLISSDRILTEDGIGDSPAVGSVLLQQSWDASNRLITQTDPNGNVTRYSYDALNREIATTYADNTVQTVTYDVHNNVIERSDPNNSVSMITHDLLNRPIRVDILPGEGVATDTTFEIYKFDGNSRIVHAQDDDSLVTRSYDSFSRIVEEIQNGQKVSAEYDAVGNMLECVYPSLRTISTTYDELDRKSMIADGGGMIAQYDYVGPGRVARREYGNGTRTEYAYNGITGVPNPANDFGVRQIIRKTHSRNNGANVFDDHQFTWDRMYNKSSRQNLRSGGETHLYTYDSQYRMIHSTKQVAGSTDEVTAYALDEAGNRSSVSGGSNPGTYTQDAMSPEPADAQLNQYTGTPADTRLYDPNGNLTRIDTLSAKRIDLSYDYRNQMVQHIDQESGVVTTYAYDVFGRRIEKVVNGGASETTRFFYVGRQVCEEQDDLGNTQATYVYGLYIDEVLSMERNGVDNYYHGDDLYNVTSLTDDNGDVIERYEYDDFGRASIADETGFPRVRSAFGNPYMFTGRRFDEESNFYYFRTRYLDSRTGRFTTRDTIGMWGDWAELGNGYTYVGNNPWTFLDPSGEGFLQMMMGNSWDDPDWELVEAAGEGAKGGGSILVNTFTFGGSDKIGLTDSTQYKGSAYDASRVAAVISREALITAATMGTGAARGGACALQGMGKLAPLVKAIQATGQGRKVANLVHKILEAINTGRDAYDLVMQLRKILDGNGSAFDAIISGLGVASGIKGLRSKPGFCFVAGTLVLTADGYVPIEALSVGDRVLTTDDGSYEGETQVNPETWRYVALEMADPNSEDSLVEITMLRPIAWIQEVGCHVDNIIQYSLPEIGLSGPAYVKFVGPCNPVRAGPGRVVLSTIKSLSNDLIELTFDGLDIALVATRRHPLFSEDQDNWVAAGDLEVGDFLRTRDGVAQLTGSIVRSKLSQVYNLEVETNHLYFVTKLNILNHNAQYTSGTSKLSELGRRGKGRGIREVVGDSKDAKKLFDDLRGSNPVTEVKPGVFIAKGKNGKTITFRESSKSGPPTVDVHEVEPGMRKIKFVRE